MSSRKYVYFIPLFTLVFAFAGCGDDGGGDVDAAVVTPDAAVVTPDAAATAAIEYYQGMQSAALGAEGNQSTCATCHSNDGIQMGFSGYTLKDIAYHTSFKGDLELDLRAAVNACVVGWMGGEALAEEDERYLMLEQYIQSISAEAETTPNEIALDLLADAAAYEAAYAGGDGAAGEATYVEWCAKCHDSALVVGLVPSLAKEALASYPIGRIAQKVRTSGPVPSSIEDAANGVDTTPGPMPFFELVDLSEQDLADIIAYLRVN